MDARKTIRPSLGERVFSTGVYLVGLAFLAGFVSERYRALAVGAFAIFGGLWLLNVWLTRIVLRHDGALIVSHFRWRFIPRTEIADVTWRRGCGASLNLVDDRWLNLPDAGQNPQGVSNSIRAWLRRSDASS